MQGLKPAERRQPRPSHQASLRVHNRQQNRNSASQFNADLPQQVQVSRNRSQPSAVRSRTNNGSTRQQSSTKNNIQATNEILVKANISPHHGRNEEHVTTDDAPKTVPQSTHGYQQVPREFGMAVNGEREIYAQQGQPMPLSQPDEIVAKLPSRKVVSQPKIREKLLGAELRGAHCSSSDDGGFIKSVASNHAEPESHAHADSEQLKPHGFSKASANNDTLKRETLQKVSDKSTRDRIRAQIIQDFAGEPVIVADIRGSDKRRALISTEHKSSYHVDYSVMKPVQLMSGISEDQTPQSQWKVLQPKGLPPHEHREDDSTSNEIASVPQLRVLTSHYQDDQQQKASQKAVSSELNEENFLYVNSLEAAGQSSLTLQSVGNGIIFNSQDQQIEVRQLTSSAASRDYMQQPRVVSPDSRKVDNSPKLTQSATAGLNASAHSKQNNLSTMTQKTQKTPSGSHHPSIQQRLFLGVGKRSDMDVLKPYVQVNGSRGEVTLAGNNELSDSLRISPMMPKSKPTSAKPRWKASQNSHVSDYNKIEFHRYRRAQHKPSSFASPNTEFGGDRTDYKASRNLQQCLGGSNDGLQERPNVKRFKTQFQINDNTYITSNNSCQSSSPRLNQDIMLYPKIDSLGVEMTAYNDMVSIKNQIDSKDLASKSLTQEAMKAQTDEPKNNGKAAIFATVSNDSQSSKGAKNDTKVPLLSHKVTQARKSVLQRDSRKALKVGLPLVGGRTSHDLLNIKDQQLRSSVAQTLRGTVSSLTQDVSTTPRRQPEHEDQTKDKDKETIAGEKIQEKDAAAATKKSKEHERQQMIQQEGMKAVKPAESLLDPSDTLRRDETANEQRSMEPQVHHNTGRLKPNVSRLECENFVVQERSLQDIVLMQQQLSAVHTSIDKAERKLTVGLTPDKGNKNQTSVRHEPHSELNGSATALALVPRKSSRGRVATSFGDESFIHPPSPILVTRVLADINKSTFTSGVSIAKTHERILSEGASSSELSRIQPKGLIHIENQNSIPTYGDENFKQSASNGKFKDVCSHEVSLNQDVVDVMHAGVDTQDFLELSGSDHGSGIQVGSITAEHDQLASASPNGDTFASKVRIGLANSGSNRRKSLDSKTCSATLTGDLSTAKKFRLGMFKSKEDFSMSGAMASSTSMQKQNHLSHHISSQCGQPTVSCCLCRELEQTPEQLAQLMQRYRRQLRLILKSETDKTRVLLVTEDGTSKDQETVECILHNSMKVDGMSIPKVVAQHREYFQMLQRIEASAEHKRKRVKMEIPTVNSPSQLDWLRRHNTDQQHETLTTRTLEQKQVMEKQLAQFVQYGQEAGTMKSQSAHEIISLQHQQNAKHQQQINKQLQVLHSKCEANQFGANGGEAGLFSPNLVQPQYLDEQARLVSLEAKNRPSIFTGQLQSTQRGDLSHSFSNCTTTKHLLAPGVDAYGHQIIKTGIQYLNSLGQSQHSSRNFMFGQNISEPNKIPPSEEVCTPVLNGIEMIDDRACFNQHYMSWSKLPKGVAQDLQEPVAAKFLRTAKLEHSEPAPSDSLARGLVPTNIEIIRPQGHDLNKMQDIHRNRTPIKSQHLKANYNQNYDQAKGVQTRKPSPPRKLLDGDQSTQSNQTYYLDRNYARAGDSAKPSALQSISPNQKPPQRRQSTPDKLLRRHSRPYQTSHETSPSLLYQNEVGDERKLHPVRGVQTAKLSNFRKNTRCSLSYEQDISTQRRQSNNMSGNQGEELEEIAGGSPGLRQNCSVKLTTRQAVQDGRDPAHLRADQSVESDSHEYLQPGPVKAKYKHSPGVKPQQNTASSKALPGNQRQAGVSGKRSQIGTLSSALNKLTPGQTEVPVNYSFSAVKKVRRSPARNHSQCRGSKEFQIMRSKQGMLTKISHSIKPVFNQRISSNKVPHYFRRASSSRDEQVDFNSDQIQYKSCGSSMMKNSNKPPQPQLLQQPLVRVHHGMALSQNQVLKRPQTRAQTQQSHPIMEETLMIQSRHTSYQDLQGNATNVTSYQDVRMEDSPLRRRTDLTGGCSSLSQGPKKPDLNNTATTIISGDGDTRENLESYLVNQNIHLGQIDVPQPLQQNEDELGDSRPLTNPIAGKNLKHNSFLELPSAINRDHLNSSQGDLPFADMRNEARTSFRQEKISRPQTRQAVDRVAQSSCNPGRRSKVAQKSASLLRVNAQNPNFLSSSNTFNHLMNPSGYSSFNRLRHKKFLEMVRNTPLDKSTNDKLSVDAIIKDLGDQDSELNRNLLKTMKSKANFKSGALQRNIQVAESDYDCKSINQNSIPIYQSTKSSNLPLRSTQTGRNLFSASNLGYQQIRQHQSSSAFDLTTTADHSFSQNNLLQANEWADSMLIPVPGQALNIIPPKNLSAAIYASEAQTPVDPVQQLVALSIQGRLTTEAAKQARSYHSRRRIDKQVPDPNAQGAEANKPRARVLSHNKNIRHKMDQRANGIYYHLRKTSHLDVAREMGIRFREANSSHIVDFKNSCGSKGMTPLEKYYEQQQHQQQKLLQKAQERQKDFAIFQNAQVANKKQRHKSANRILLQRTQQQRRELQ